MSKYKMVEVSTDANGNSLYHVRERNGGGLVTDKQLTEAEALALMNGETTTKKKKKSKDDYENMTKLELEAMMRTHGVELDIRLTKEHHIKHIKETLNG